MVTALLFKNSAAIEFSDTEPKPAKYPRIPENLPNPETQKPIAMDGLLNILVAGALSNIAWKPLQHNKTEKISNRVTPSVTPNLTVVARFDS